MYETITSPTDDRNESGAIPSAPSNAAGLAVVAPRTTNQPSTATVAAVMTRWSDPTFLAPSRLKTANAAANARAAGRAGVSRQ